MKNFNISDCIQEAEAIENLFSKFIDLCVIGEEYKSIGYTNIKENYVKVTDEAKTIQRELLRRYEIWFAVTKLIVKQYSDNYSEFESYYDKIKNSLVNYSGLEALSVYGCLG